jgi:hypothetical protein
VRERRATPGIESVDRSGIFTADAPTAVASIPALGDTEEKLNVVQLASVKLKGEG